MLGRFLNACQARRFLTPSAFAIKRSLFRPHLGKLSFLSSQHLSAICFLQYKEHPTRRFALLLDLLAINF